MGFQEPAPRYAYRKRRLAPAWWVALAVVVVAGWIWIERRTDPSGDSAEPATVPPVSETKEVKPEALQLDPSQAEQIVDLQHRLGDAQAQLDDQRLEVESLEEQLEEARSDAELHKRGLERAVAELNQINKDLGQLQALSQAIPRASAPPGLTEKVRPLGAPYVTTTLNGWVVASGLVHNPTKYLARGTLEVSLVGSSGVIDTRGFLMDIDAGETDRYDVTFTHIFPTERLGAQARWVE